MSTLTLAPEQAVKSATWGIDSSHTTAGFSVKHMMISNVRGEFKSVQGSVYFDGEQPELSKIDVAIEARSISTGDEKRDAHLTSPDFFDVDQFPALTFTSTRWTKTGESSYAILGDLTIKGVTRQVTLTAEGPTPEIQDPWGGTRIGFSAETKINRKDFGLTWNIALETGGLLVGELVKIAIEAELVKQ